MVALIAGAPFASPSGARAIELRDAVALMLNSSPEIGEAAANRAAVGFEEEQAQRRYRPNLILEGRVGPEWTNNSASQDTKMFSLTKARTNISTTRNRSERSSFLLWR